MAHFSLYFKPAVVSGFLNKSNSQYYKELYWFYLYSWHVIKTVRGKAVLGLNPAICTFKVRTQPLNGKAGF